MKVTGDWLRHPASQAVCRCLTDAGYQAFFVGGCVRNALLNEPVGDIDISTNAHPDKVTDLAQRAGFHVIPTGIDHGTVTVLADGVPHEITTFRTDVSTDGRHAEVAFSDTMAEDARRRDFTINALYADATGQVYDPVTGLPDLRARYVRFIDDAGQRIREDFLRTLRFFRFNAWYGDPAGGFDPDALNAIATHLEGLTALSRERVGTEMLKLLAAKDPVASVAVMRTTGVLAVLLPGSDDTALGPLTVTEEQAGIAPDPLLRLAALGGDSLSDRLRLSRAETKTLTILREAVEHMTSAGELGYRHGADLATKALALRAALFQESIDPRRIESALKGAKAVFPVTARDLMPALAGAALGKRLKDLERRWIDSDFSLDKAQLLGDV